MEKPVIEEQFDPDRTILSLPFVKNRQKKAAIKNDEKKVTKKKQMQYDKILVFMEEGKEYGIWDFLKGLTDYIDIVGGNRDRRYKKK